MAVSYIGSTITVVSNRDIRYEGILTAVDTAAATVSLQNVRFFGTEGRNPNGTEIPGSDAVYPLIVFSGTDIKDLKVKGSSLVVKVGTKVKRIRLVDAGHDIDCKIDSIGAMKLKSKFVKKL